MVQLRHRNQPASRQSGMAAFAALDLGTNNCRLLVGAPASDGFRVLDSFSRIVRLGEGLHHSGELSPGRDGPGAWGRCMRARRGCGGGRCGGCGRLPPRRAGGR